MTPLQLDPFVCVCEFVYVHTERSEVTYNQIIPPFLIFQGLCLDLRSALRELFCLLSALHGSMGSRPGLETDADELQIVTSVHLMSDVVVSLVGIRRLLAQGHVIT